MECISSRFIFECRFFCWLITIFISIVVLLLWFPLKQKPGIGTILNALIIGLMIDFCIKICANTRKLYIIKFYLGAIAVVTVGLGGGIYLVAKLRCRTKRWFDDRFTKKNKFTNCIS